MKFLLRTSCDKRRAARHESGQSTRAGGNGTLKSDTNMADPYAFCVDWYVWYDHGDFLWPNSNQILLMRTKTRKEGHKENGWMKFIKCVRWIYVMMMMMMIHSYNILKIKILHTRSFELLNLAHNILYVLAYDNS